MVRGMAETGPPPDDLGAAAAELRAEWRTDEDEYARAAMAQWAHSRGLVDIAQELMHRGDTVSVTAGRSTFVGTVADVGVDYLQLSTGAARVDVPVATLTPGSHHDVRLGSPVVLQVVERALAGGHRSSGPPGTFRACLLEHEEQGAELEVGSMLHDELRGVPTVARDHLALADPEGRDSYVPLAWVSWVRRR